MDDPDVLGRKDLDYLPLRLTIMTLWTRHVQRIRPDMDAYPHDRVEDTTLGQDEDVAEPLLKLNAYCAWRRRWECFCW